MVQRVPQDLFRQPRQVHLVAVRPDAGPLPLVSVQRLEQLDRGGALGHEALREFVNVALGGVAGVERVSVP